MPKSPCWDRVSGQNVRVLNPTKTPLELLGKPLSELEVWRLARALDGTTIQVVPGLASEPEVIYQIIGNNVDGTDLYGSCSMHLIRRSEGSNSELILQNHGYYLIGKYQGAGYAWAALALQVETAYNLGFSRIVAMARGHHPARAPKSQIRDDRSTLTDRVGAIQWPKLGFDGLIPDTFWNGVPTVVAEDLRLQRGDMLSKLLETEEGRELWARHPEDMTMTLQLRPLSSGAQKLLAWVKTIPQSVRRK